jgi:hypothetical protein
VWVHKSDILNRKVLMAGKCCGGPARINLAEVLEIET